MPARRRPLLIPTPDGLYLPDAGVHVDPWNPVDRAILTHGHADHARPGTRHVLAAASGVGILKRRLGSRTRIEGVQFGTPISLGSARISLHPAGHILGSAQIRVEVRGEVWVITGDCKRAPDPTAEPFEPIRSDTLVCECTFGLPIYRWPDPDQVSDAILDWWLESASRGQTAVLGGYALGKAQRLLRGVADAADRRGISLPGPLWVHGAVDALLEPYREAGISLPPSSRPPDLRVARGGRSGATRAGEYEAGEYEAGGSAQPRAREAGALVLAPPSALQTPWIRRFGPVSTALASGWMQLRGTRRRRGLDRGFVLSDHLDWPGLLETVAESGAERLYLTHGTTGPAVRFFREKGLDAHTLETQFEGEGGADEASDFDEGTP
jgi:putative mRNA 3-end processing factor